MSKGMSVGKGRGQRGNNNPQTWEKFVEQAAETAKRVERKKPRRMTEAQLANLKLSQKGQGRPDPTPEGRCDFIKRDGSQCGNWAMRGASRCHTHGGYRQNPNHPATGRRFLSGDVDRQTQHREARDRVAKGDPKARSAAQRELKDRGIGRNAVDTLEGMTAFLADDGGKTWRRWLKSLNIRHAQAQAKVARDE